MKQTSLTLLFLWLLLTSTIANAAQVLFTPALILTERYSDNIFLVPDIEDANITKEEDYITSAGLSLTGQVIGRTAGLELNYTPTYNAFATNTDFDYWRHTGRVLLWNDFSRYTRLEITDTYLETENPLDESEDYTPDDPTQGPDIEPDTTRRGRNRYRTNTAQIRLSHRFGERDNYYLALQHDMHEDVDPDPDIPVRDYRNLQPSLGMTYWFAQRWGIALDGYYSNRDYEDESDREEISGYVRFLRAITRNLSGFIEYRQTYLNYDEETEQDYRLHQSSIGADYQFQETAHITLAAAYYIQDYQDLEDDADDNGWSVNSDIYKRWAFQRSYIDLTGGSGYDIDDTGVEDRGLNFFYQGRLELGRTFTPRFTGNIFGSYRYDEYPNLTPEVGS